MTRKEWYDSYRQSRLSRKPLILSGLSVLLKEIYSIQLYGKDSVLYWLITKYESKVSLRLLDKKKNLQEKGKEEASHIMKKLVYSENPLFKLMPKDNGFHGAYYPLPTSLPQKKK